LRRGGSYGIGEGRNAVPLLPCESLKTGPIIVISVVVDPNA
jgi:hypothetical protein